MNCQLVELGWASVIRPIKAAGGLSSQEKKMIPCCSSANTKIPVYANMCAQMFSRGMNDRIQTKLKAHKSQIANVVNVSSCAKNRNDVTPFLSKFNVDAQSALMSDV